MEAEINRAVIVPPSKCRPAAQIPTSTSRKKINNKDRNKKSSESELKDSTLCYRMSDVVLSLGLILPLVIGFWRGVWQLMDIYSARWGVDPWLSIGTGYIIPFLLYWLQEPLRSTIHPSRMNFGLFYIFSRCLLLVHSFGSVNQWRGLWVLLDIYTGVEGTKGAQSAIVSLVVGVFFSVILRTFCNVLAPPLCVFVDEGNSIHDCPLRFKTSPRFQCRYFLDCIFSVVVIASLVVCCWRGVWNLADIYLYPGVENEMKSALASLSFGYGLCLLMFIVQPYVHRLEMSLSGLARLVIFDTLTFLQFLGCVFAWRGLWNSYNILVVFETETTSEWVTTLVGAAGAVLFGCVSAIVVRGISIDCEDNGDGFDEWSIPYISLLKTRIYDVPFPEPWVCRYLCTAQKMNIGTDKGKHRHHVNTNSVKPDYEASSTPLKQMNLQPQKNSVHPEDPFNLSHNRFSDFPNIDSSSEEELGMRTSMLPSHIQEDDTTGTQEV